MKLLIAEDDPDMQKILKLYLQREGDVYKRQAFLRHRKSLWSQSGISDKISSVLPH